MVTITGRLLFEDKEGTIREDLTQYAGGARVYLTGKDGKTNSAALMPDGTFRYTGRIWQEGEFTLFYTLPANKGLAFTQDNPEGKIQLDLTFSSGEVTIPAMYVTDTKPPAIELETQDAQGTTTRIDPILVKFNADDASPVSFSWQVRNKQGELLFHGEGEQAALPPEQLPVGKSTETYYIQVTATDAALNQSQLEYYFYRVAP